MRSILIFGGFPPPIGGVTLFIENLFDAADKADNLNAEIDLFSFFRMFDFKYSVWHINYSNSFKRFLYVITGKLLRRKVFFVKHGGAFDMRDPFVYLSIQLSDGVFCLNDTVLYQLKRMNKRCLKQTTIYKENLQVYDSLEKVKDGNNSKGKIVFYINNNKSLNGAEIYGATFIYNALDDILKNNTIVVVDLSGSYKSLFDNRQGVTYMAEATDFRKLLSSSEIYIRPTSTDGMSLAILEAGLLGVKVLASDVVERPEFSYTYMHGCKKDFLDKLNLISSIDFITSTPKLTSVHQVIDFMEVSNV